MHVPECALPALHVLKKQRRLQTEASPLLTGSQGATLDSILFRQPSLRVATRASNSGQKSTRTKQVLHHGDSADGSKTVLQVTPTPGPTS